MAGEKRVTIVNLTGHPLRLGSQGNNLRFRSGAKVRLDTRHHVIEKVIVETEDGTVTVPILGLSPGVEDDAVPEPEDGVLYVVSGLVAGRVKRHDVVSPAQIHREDGRVMYARALLRYTDAD